MGTALWWTTTRPWDLVLAIGIVLLLDVLAALGVEGPLRVLVGAPALLAVPGYLLVAAAFPRRRRVVETRAGEPGEEETRKDEEGLAPLVRAALSVGLSVAVVPLLGIGLHFTGQGVRLASFLAALTLFALVAGGVAAWRRRRLPEGERFLLAVPRPGWATLAPPDRALAVLLAASIVAAGAAVAYVLLAPREGEPYTEFYLLGPGGRAEDYPSALRRGEEARVLAGVVNHEGARADYVVRVVAEAGTMAQVDGAAVFRAASARTLASWNLTLEDERRWEENVTFRLEERGLHRVRFELEKPGAPEPPYRRLHLFVNVTG